ncbi:MAG TPA: hypothetical protein EYQ82_04610 [Dehalococcoidia bacterium]|nr:hypothetical protein [Dehalococcoidia bacterium]HIM28623.1 hypothetical protein [Planctomycetota bacterium]
MTEIDEPNGKRSIVAISEVAKLQINLAAHPNIPRGAMCVNEISLNDTPSTNTDLSLFWPTTIGSTTYLNTVTYNMETKKLDTSDKAYIIVKYVVTGDSVTVYGLGDSKISSRLGSDYNSADLLQEITKATDWKPFLKFDRIRF